MFIPFQTILIAAHKYTGVSKKSCNVLDMDTNFVPTMSEQELITITTKDSWNLKMEVELLVPNNW